MSGDLERYDREERSNAMERFAQPPPRWSRSGAIDRRNEGKHVAVVRQIRRETEQWMVREASNMQEYLARAESRDQLLSDAKFRIMRAYNESAMMAGGNPVVEAQFAMLDDAFAMRFRIDQMRREPGGAS